MAATAFIIGVSSQDGSYRESYGMFACAGILFNHESERRSLQNSQPKDYVIGTNQSHTVEDVCRIAFAHVGLAWRAHVTTSDTLLRPTEIAVLTGDYSLAKAELGWQPRTSLTEMICRMVDADLKRFR